MKFNMEIFCFGIVAARLCMDGIIHTDLRKDNVICGRLVDYGGSIKFFKYPDDLLDISVLRLLLISLKSSIRELPQEQIAWFRLGYICAGGILSQQLFDILLVENNLSSFVLDDTEFSSTVTLQGLDKDDINILSEWKKIDFKQLNEIPFHHYGRYKIRKKVNVLNLYYLDLYYFSLLYANCCMEYESTHIDQTLIYFNLGNLECAFHHSSLAYGFFKTALYNCKHIKNAETSTYISSMIQEKLLGITDMPYYKLKLIETILTQREKNFAELVWELYDIENSRLDKIN